MSDALGDDLQWTNRSVLDFAKTEDPVEAISKSIGTLLLEAADADLLTLPTNPFELAAHMGIGLRPRYDVSDARLVSDDVSAHQAQTSSAADATSSTGAREDVIIPSLARFVNGEGLVIEYNPTRPRGRLRYSVAHELAHALFSDAGLVTRHRTGTGAIAEGSHDDNWQLELLCNIAAAELLMPDEAMLGVFNSATDIDFLMAQRARFDVSTEALLRRFVHAADRPMNLVALARTRDDAGAPLRAEYVVASRASTAFFARGDQFAAGSTFGVPMAVGQTARGRIVVENAAGGVDVQAVGVAPYPGARLPRVLAIVEPERPDGMRSRLEYVTGDIVDAVPQLSRSQSTAPGPRRLIAHVVSDAARAWGRTGVAAALGRRLPDAANAFRAWAVADPNHLTLGNVHVVDIPASPNGPMVDIASLVVQSGFGPSTTARLSYAALGQALETIADRAHRGALEVHIPRIGAGQAGGRWDLIEATIERTLLDRGVRTVVYTKPFSDPRDRA